MVKQDAFREAPSPALVAARYVVGDLDEKLVPMWAAWWVANGDDGTAVVTPAGLSGTDPADVRDAVRPALDEIGITIPPFPQGWRVVAADRAADCLAGRFDEFDLAAWVERIYHDSNYHDAVIKDPLGAIYGVDDEHVGGWGRTDAALRAEVRSICQHQTRLGYG